MNLGLHATSELYTQPSLKFLTFDIWWYPCTKELYMYSNLNNMIILSIFSRNSKQAAYFLWLYRHFCCFIVNGTLNPTLGQFSYQYLLFFSTWGQYKTKFVSNLYFVYCSVWNGRVTQKFRSAQDCRMSRHFITMGCLMLRCTHNSDLLQQTSGNGDCIELYNTVTSLCLALKMFKEFCP